jgi:VanZ family protein
MHAVNPALRFRALWLAIGYGLIALIVYLSLTSDPVDLDTGLPYQDKLFHMLAYFTVTAWFVQIFHARRHLNRWAIAFLCLGLSMEFVQSFEPTRTAEFADMLANTIGVTLGYALSATPLKYVLIRIERFIRG